MFASDYDPKMPNFTLIILVPGANPVKLIQPKLHRNVAKLKFIMIYINFDIIYVKVVYRIETAYKIDLFRFSSYLAAHQRYLASVNSNSASGFLSYSPQPLQGKQELYRFCLF